MNAQDLKNSILQLAVQGKLVEQRPEEGTAKELLAQIKAEKEQLIKDKKIKKEKPLPEITEDEIPFEIPESWEWVRLGDCIILLSGQDMTPDKYNTDGLGIPYLTGASNIADGDIIINRWTDVPRAIAVKGNLLVTCKGTIGTTCVLKEEQVHIARQIMAITPLRIDTDYMHVFVQYYVGFLKKKAKSMIPGIERKDVLEALFPIPPLGEQKRIVAKIEELLPYIEKYDRAYTKLEAFNKKFPEDMKKSILQMAMQGKLVEQRPEEGTADKLYEQIVAEKARLIKEGKIKKEKPLLEIAEDEIPFEIPASWKWVRLGTVSTYGHIKQKISTNDIKADMWILDLEDIEKGTGRIVQKVFASERKIAGDKVAFKSGNILYSKLRPYLLKILIANEDGICTPELVPFDVYRIHTEYVMWVLRSPHVDFAVNSVSYGVKMPRVGTDTMLNLLIPLPPLGEQKRIVAKLEQMLPYCDRLMN